MARLMWTVHVRPMGPNDRQLRLVARLHRDGKRIKELGEGAKTTDLQVAEARAELWQAELQRLADEAIAPVRPSCLTPIDLRLRGMPEDNSRVRMEDARKRLVPHLEAVALDELDRARLRLVQDALRAEGRAATTVNTTIGALSAAWGWAFERDLVDRPFPRVKQLRRDPVNKRPYTDSEVVEVVAWVLAARPWAHPIVATIADAGRRVGEIVAIQGRDVRRKALELHLRVKGNRIEVVPISPEVMALIPETASDAFVWPKGIGAGWRCALDARKHVTSGAVLRVVKIAVRAIGIPDPERLDVHSLRRAFVASCDRAGVPSDVGRRVTGHKTRAMWEHYQAGYAGDDLHEAVAAVRARRYPTKEGGELAPDSPPKAKGLRSQPEAPLKLAVGLEPTTSSLRILKGLAHQKLCVATLGRFPRIPRSPRGRTWGERAA